MVPIKVMIVDEHAQRAELLECALREQGFEIVTRASTTDDLPTAVKRTDPDVVLIDIDAPSRDALENISAMNRQQPRPIVMFSRQQDRQVIEAAIQSGVSAYIVDGLSSASVRPVIDVAIATFRRFNALQKELDRTKTSLSQRKVIERAKGILMKQSNATEPEAYRVLQKLAMDRKCKLIEVARNVIEMAELFSSGTK